MGISSVGVGSGVLTQDVIDQLKAADEAQFVTPLNNRMDDQNKKIAALDELTAYVDNTYESLKVLDEYGVFESRTGSSSNDTAVKVSVADSSDIQDFTLNVTQLATKEIEQSGSFTTNTDTIATSAGTMTLTVGSQSFDIAYDATTTLDDLKNSINTTAGNTVNATVVQVAANDYRLILNAAETGTGQAISVADSAGGTLNTALTTGMTNVQTAVDAEFTYNGVAITRTSNSVSDLLSGVTLTLDAVGSSDISVKQDRDNIESKINNFIDKYNSAMYQLSTVTKSSQNVEDRGVFSSDSTIKNMKRSLESILATVGGGVGRLEDYGIELDADGRLSLNAETLNTKLDEDPRNTQIFLTGGTFTNADGSTTEVTGAFKEIENEFARYSKYNTILDQYKTSQTDRLDSLTTQRDKANERLTAKYDIMAKQFAAYDAIISQYNSASSMFTQLIDAQNSSNN